MFLHHARLSACPAPQLPLESQSLTLKQHSTAHTERTAFPQHQQSPDVQEPWSISINRVLVLQHLPFSSMRGRAYISRVLVLQHLPFSSMRGRARLTVSPASPGGVTWGSHSRRVRFRSVLTSTAAAARTLSLMSSTARSVMLQTSLSLVLTSAHRRPCSRSDKALQLASLLRHSLPPIS